MPSMEGIALAPQAQATEGGQSTSKSSVDMLPPTVSSYAVKACCNRDISLMNDNHQMRYIIITVTTRHPDISTPRDIS